MTEAILDAGTAIPAFRDGTTSGFALVTTVCARAGCPLLHLRAVEAAAGDHVEPGQKGLLFDLDVETRRLEGRNDGAQACLESESGAWLRAWVERSAAVLRSRFDLLKGQQRHEPPDARPAPRWEPGARVAHHELYPYDFAPRLRHGGELWLIADACCPDPGCDCDEASLTFLGVNGKEVVVSGQLGARQPAQKDRLGRALWEAVHADPALLQQLRDRRDEIRYAGPFVVGAAYEQARLAARKLQGAPAAIGDAGGYLQGGGVPLALVERVFDVGARFYAARGPLCTSWWGQFRVELRGAIERDAWGIVEDDPLRLSLFGEVDAETPWLEFVVADRDYLPLEHRRQRCAFGLPLLGGTSLPLVTRVRPDGEDADPDADDVRLAVAVAEAVLAVPCEELDEVAAAPRTFERRVESDAGAIDVRLTVSPAEAPWDEDIEGGEPPESGDLDDDGDDEDDDDEPGSDVSADTAVEAFTDAALDRGLPTDTILAARALAGQLASYASEEGGIWFHEATVTRFLEDYAPRKVMLADAEIDRAPAALRAIAEWLGEMHHADARRLQSAIDRALPVFQRRARDPRQFGMAKALFSEMGSAGVDLGDQTAIDRYLAVMNAGQLGAHRPVPATAGVERSPTRVERSPDRWKPAPGERAPAPTDPCGCGSGRRYKKCCMPR